MSALQKHPIIQENTLYTYEDYAKWDDGNRWELIDGVPRMMGAPTFTHQRLIFLFGMQFEGFLKGKNGTFALAPFDVRLNHKTKDNRVVQPDVLVICDKNKLGDGKNLKGAPDLAIEILSPSSTKHDQVTKFRLYKQAGVREYWIVDPTAKTVGVHILEKDNLGMRYYDETESIPVHVLEGFDLDLSQVFEPDVPERETEQEAQTE